MALFVSGAKGCHALAVFNALTRVVQEIADGMALTEAKSMQEEIADLGAEVAKNEHALEDALRRLLRGVFNTNPVLLILDDLEQALETPSADRPEVQPQAPYAPALRAVLSAFREATTASRLLVTSRFDFTLTDGGGNDLAAGLARVPLTPMRARERQKQWRARMRSEDKETEAAAAPEDLVDAALAAAGGNPGLQAELTRPLLMGETEAAEAAIEAIQAFRATGAPPPEGVDLGDFFGRMAFETYAAALTATQKAALSAATLFTDAVAPSWDDVRLLELTVCPEDHE